MGQKTNPNIFRLGKIKEWKSRYIEKKTSESSTVIFRDLEIKKFIFLFFERHNLKIQNYHINYSESSLHVAVSYYNAFSSLLIKKKIKARYKTLHSTLFQNRILNIKKALARKQFYTPKAYKREFLKSTKLKLFQNHYFLRQKSQRLKTMQNLKFYIDKKNPKTPKPQNPFHFLDSLQAFSLLFPSVIVLGQIFCLTSSKDQSVEQQCISNIGIDV